MCAQRAGIVSPIPDMMPKYGARAFRPSGGGMPKEPPKCRNGHDSMAFSRRRRFEPFCRCGCSRCQQPHRLQPRHRMPIGMACRPSAISSYPSDFPHFNYVNPKAPKGGVFSQIGPNRQFNQSFQTFNSLNSFILKGRRRARHGAYVCERSWCGRATSPMPCTGLPRAAFASPMTG